MLLYIFIKESLYVIKCQQNKRNYRSSKSWNSCVLFWSPKSSYWAGFSLDSNKRTGNRLGCNFWEVKKKQKQKKTRRVWNKVIKTGVRKQKIANRKKVKCNFIQSAHLMCLLLWSECFLKFSEEKLFQSSKTI